MSIILGITGTYEGYYSGNGYVYNRGSWGSGYSTSWISKAHTNNSNATFTSNSTSISFSTSSAAVSNWGNFYFGSSSKLIVTNAYSKLSVIIRSFRNTRDSSFGVTVLSSAGGSLASGSVNTSANQEYQISISLSTINTSVYLIFGGMHIGTNNTLEWHGFELYSIIFS